MVGAASESSVENYFTRQYIPEDKSELHTRRRENLKSHTTTAVYYTASQYWSIMMKERMLLKNENQLCTYRTDVTVTQNMFYVRGKTLRLTI
jgi:hypothetical protein